MTTPYLRRKYPYIVAWSHMMGSKDYYIDEQVEQAHRDHAPENAIYEEYDDHGRTGKWATFDQVTSPSSLYEMKVHYLPAVGIDLK